MISRGQTLLWVSVLGLTVGGCASNRTCCKQCGEFDGIPLENVAAYQSVDGESFHGQVLPGTAPESPEWKSAPTDQQPQKQVPPIVHPSPPPRQSTSSKIDDQGKTPETPKPLPKESQPELKKLPDRIEVPAAKNVDTPPAVKKDAQPKTVQQTPRTETQQLSPKTATPNLDTPRPPVRNADMRPASLRVKVSTSMVVTSIGDRVTFDIVVENQGGMTISNVDLQATFNDNLKPLDTDPIGAGTILRNTVAFPAIKNLGNTPQRFKVRAEVLKQDGGVGLVTVEALSPILTAGPLRDQATVRILPKE